MVNISVDHPSNILPTELLQDRARYIALSDDLSITANRMYDLSVEAAKLHDIYEKFSSDLKSKCGHFNLTKISSYEWRCDNCDVLYNHPQPGEQSVNEEYTMPTVKSHPYYGEKQRG